MSSSHYSNKYRDEREEDRDSDYKDRSRGYDRKERERDSDVNYRDKSYDRKDKESELGNKDMEHNRYESNRDYDRRERDRKGEDHRSNRYERYRESAKYEPNQGERGAVVAHSNSEKYNSYRNNENRSRGDRYEKHPDFDSRRKLREECEKTPWLESPEISETDSIRSISPERSRKKSKKSKKGSKYSDGERESSKRHKRSKRSKEERSSRKKHRSSHSDSEDESRDRRHTRRYTSSIESSTEHHRDRSISQEKAQAHREALDDDGYVGPQPLFTGDIKFDPKGYGGDLLAGEGEAMASYVQSGKRIPRRGEIGLTSDQISTFEGSGYVMSGSRHQLMNAVRIRKENQVISYEEKRSMLKSKHEENIKQESEAVNTFREILNESLKKE